MTAAGGLYTSAADLARFLRFELNGGSIDGRVVLDPKWLTRWRRCRRRAPARRRGTRSASSGTAGTAGTRARISSSTAVEGSGSSPNVVGAPAWDRGRRPDQLPGPSAPERARAVDPGRPRERARCAIAIGCLRCRRGRRPRIRICRSSLRPGWRTSSPRPPWPRRVTRPPAGRPTPAPTECPRGGTSTRPVRRTGSSSTPASRTSRPTTRRTSLVRHRLAEVEPGLFLADNGETLDLRGHVPTWRNLRLVRVSGGPSPWQWAILVDSRARRSSRGWSPRWRGASGAPPRGPSSRSATPPAPSSPALVAVCDRTAHARNGDPSRVDAGARRRRVPGLARPVPR